MILSQDPERALAGAEEATLRRDNPEAPVAASARRAIESVISGAWLSHHERLRVLDIGCRTGSLTAELEALISESVDGPTHIASLVGVDPSWEAIQEAEERHPAMTWINGSLETLVSKTETSWQLDGGFDLIIDRSYPSLVDTEEQAEREASVLSGLLSPDGSLIHVVGRTAYAHWARHTCLGWTRSLFEIRAAVLGEGVRIDDAGSYVIVRGSESRLAPTEPLPGETQIRELTFDLSDGSCERWYVAGNEGMQLRAWHHASRAGALPPYRFRVPPGASSSIRNNEAPLLERTRDSWQPGRPAVMDPGGALIGRQGRRVRYQAQLYERLEASGLNVLHHPNPTRDVRGYQVAINEWVAALPDLVILGPGLLDARNDPSREARVVTDIDQFRYVLGWVIERLQEEARAAVAWVHFEPPHADELEGGNIRREDIAAFAAVGRNVAEARGVPVHEVPYERVTQNGAPAAPLAADEVLAAVRQALEVPVGDAA